MDLFHLASRLLTSSSEGGSIFYRRFNLSTLDVPLPENSPSARIVNPHLYSLRTCRWRPFETVPGQVVLDQGSLLKVVSWNIDFMAAGRAKRASSAMDHLEEAFGDRPLPLAIMLQEVHCESLLAILGHPWIRKNFVLSDVGAPQSYFTLMMVSRHTQTQNWFRVPLQSRMQRDILAVDIPISHFGSESASPKKILRLCTTHLESLWEPEGEELRPHQLAQISALLKAPPTCVTQVIGGLVGGDMNHISRLDSASHKTGNVELYDVWEDICPPPIPPRKPFQKDLTFGRAKANTWGYQSQSAKSRKRHHSVG